MSFPRSLVLLKLVCLALPPQGSSFLIQPVPPRTARLHQKNLVASLSAGLSGRPSCCARRLGSSSRLSSRRPVGLRAEAADAGGFGGCSSDDECEIVYDDDDDVDDPADASSNEDGASTVAIAADQQQIQEQEGLDQRQKVLDDGHEKQDMVKWREANVVGNDAASADERCRLLSLSLVGGEGLEHEFSKAIWLDNYKLPGQFVGIRLDDGGDGGVAGCLVAVATEPNSVRENDGTVQVLVTDEPSFRLKGDTRGPAEEARGRSLAALAVGDKVKLSDFMGRGFSSLFIGWIGLQSALQDQRDIVIVASGARGLGSVKPVLDWPQVQAHAGKKRVSVYLEAESSASAPFLSSVAGWRSAGIRVTQCFASPTQGSASSLEDIIFAEEGLREVVGGDPAASSFLMAGLPGKRAMELTDRLTDHGVDPSRLLFNDFF